MVSGTGIRAAFRIMKILTSKWYNLYMPHNLLDISTIYYEPSVLTYTRGQEILNNYPNVKRIEVASHWNIPELHRNEDLVEDWNKVKRACTWRQEDSKVHTFLS